MLSKNLFRRPKNRLEDVEYGQTFDRPSVPDELYTACPACKQSILTEHLSQALYVCTRCGHHLRIGARKRIEMIADEGSFREMFSGMTSGNPLGFPEYDEKLRAAAEKSGECEGVVTGLATFGGAEAAVFAMDPGFMMGSMGTVLGEKITMLFEYACERMLPVVGYTVSGGARMQEGILSLMQMAKTSGAVKRHSQSGLLYLCILTDPTTGGVTASFAMEADITLAEPKALIGFAGPRVIEQTIRQKLPEGFQSAEFQLRKGFVDQIVPRESQRGLIAKLLLLHGREEAGA